MSSRLVREIYKDILPCQETVILFPEASKSVLSSIFSILASGQSQLPQEYHQHYQEIIDTSTLLGIQLSHLTILQNNGSDLTPVDYVRIPFIAEKTVNNSEFDNDFNGNNESDNDFNENHEDSDYFDDIKPDSLFEDSLVNVKNEIASEVKINETEEIVENDLEDDDNGEENDKTIVDTKATRDVYQFVGHHYEKIGDSLWKCLKCKFKATNEAKMVTHIGIRHNAMRIRTADRDYLCMFCDVKLRTKTALDRHISEIHEGVDLTLSCDLCDFKCRTAETMDAHKAKNHGTKAKYEVECPDCAKMFSCTSSLIIHRKSIHLLIRKNCELCDYTAGTSMNLNNHINKVHEGIRYQCTICNGVLGQKFRYTEHMKKLHKEHDLNDYELKKVYKCFNCKKVFKEKFQRDAHSSKCTGSKVKLKKQSSFECNICFKTFTAKKSLRTHIESIHNNIKEKCTLCEYRGIKGNLMRHMIKKHSNKMDDAEDEYY